MKIRLHHSTKEWTLPAISNAPVKRASIVDVLNRNARRVPTWVIYVLGAGWAGWKFWQGVTGALGPEPINALERVYGELALQMMVVTLLISPLRRFAGLNLIRFRRALGLTCFFFVVAHLSVWALLDIQSLSRVWADILKRPYITVGMSAFVLLIPLALTSNDWSVRKLGGIVWRRIHMLTYPVAVLAIVHYIWLTKGFPYEPLLYGAAILVLFGLRIRLPKR